MRKGQYQNPRALPATAGRANPTQIVLPPLLSVEYSSLRGYHFLYYICVRTIIKFSKRNFKAKIQV